MKVLAFGIVKEIFDGPEIDVDLARESSVATLKDILERRYPQLNELGSYMIAVNNAYSAASDVIQLHDEVAIIPPVSGG